MLRIAICDDDGAERAATRALLDGYLADHGLTVQIKEFTAARELLFAVDDAPFDLYLLDVVMPEMNGIELGVRLRETDKEGLILYLTTSEDFAIDSYEARAFWYLVKPVRPEKLYPVLDRAAEVLRRREGAAVQVRTQDGVERLMFDDIYYIDSADRAMRYVHRAGRTVSTADHTPFPEKAAPLLGDGRFYLCGASLVLNLHHIKTVDKSGVTLDTGERLEVPRRSVAELRTAWKEYWLGGGGR